MFGLTTELPITYSIFCILLGVVYAYFLYRKNKFASKSITTLLFIFRFLVVSILAFLLLNPITTNRQTTTEKPLVVLAQDASVSCKNEQDYKQFQELKESLLEDFDVIDCHYSDEVKEGFTEDKNGQSTNSSILLDEIDLKYSGRNLMAVVLSSDGLYNEGSNPLYHKISKSVPFYTIALGDTSVIKDVSISEVLHNEISFLGNISPVEVQIKSEKYKGETLQIKLYSGNKLLQTKSHKISSNSDFIKTSFKVEHNTLSLQKYRVEVSGVKQEEYLDNNSNTFFIDVLDTKYKILILSDKVHPDIAAFKSVLDKNKNYDVDIDHLSDFTSSFEEYNLIVSFYIPNSKSEILRQLKESSVPLLLFVNPNSISFLESIYPEGKVVGKNKSQEVTASYNTKFRKFNVSPDLQNYLNNLPPLYSTFGKYSTSATSDILAYQNIGIHTTEKSLISLDESINRKIAVVYAEGIWRWKINDREGKELHQNFNELFSKISQYLLIKEDKSRFRISYDKKIQEGKSVEFRSEYYNENYELNNSKEVRIDLKNEKGEKFNYVFSKFPNSSYYLNIPSLSEGKYFFTASYNSGQETKKGEFSILPRKQEGSVNTANHQLLYQLSEQSNGKMFEEFNVSEIKEELVSSNLNKSILHTSEKTSSILNNIWFFFSLLSLLCTEWIVRKYNGFY